MSVFQADSLLPLHHSLSHLPQVFPRLVRMFLNPLAKPKPVVYHTREPMTIPSTFWPPWATLKKERKKDRQRSVVAVSQGKQIFWQVNNVAQLSSMALT